MARNFGDLPLYRFDDCTNSIGLDCGKYEKWQLYRFAIVLITKCMVEKAVHFVNFKESNNERNIVKWSKFIGWVKIHLKRDENSTEEGDDLSAHKEEVC